MDWDEVEVELHESLVEGKTWLEGLEIAFVQNLGFDYEVNLFLLNIFLEKSIDSRVNGLAALSISKRSWLRLWGNAE